MNTALSQLAAAGDAGLESEFYEPTVIDWGPDPEPVYSLYKYNWTSAISEAGDTVQAAIAALPAHAKTRINFYNRGDLQSSPSPLGSKHHAGHHKRVTPQFQASPQIRAAYKTSQAKRGLDGGHDRQHHLRNYAPELGGGQVQTAPFQSDGVVNTQSKRLLLESDACTPTDPTVAASRMPQAVAEYGTGATPTETQTHSYTNIPTRKTTG